LTVCTFDGGIAATFLSAFTIAASIEAVDASGVAGRDRLKNQSELDDDFFDTSLPLEEARLERTVDAEERRLPVFFVAALPLDDGRLGDVSVFVTKLLGALRTPVPTEAGRVGLATSGGERY
jgi:hypothetical protein